MQPERQYAVTVLAGLAAAALCLALRSPATVVVGAAAVYAGGGYYTAEHPDVLRGREGDSWESGVLAGATTLAMLGVFQAEPGGGVVVLAFGLVWFGFVDGVAYARAA